MLSRRQLIPGAIAILAIALATSAGVAGAQVADPYDRDAPTRDAAPAGTGSPPRATPHTSSPASGTVDEANRETARTLVVAGVESAQAGRWEEARTKFEQAYRIYPSPNILVNLGAAQAELGLLVEAAESYRTFLAEGTDPRLADRRAAVQEQLTVLEARIPRLQVTLTGFEPGDTLTLDGHAITREALAAGVPLDPGSHRVVASRGGAPLRERSVTLVERQPQSLTLDLTPPPTETAPRADAEEVTVDLGADREYRASRLRTMQAMLGIGTVLTVGAAVVGGMARVEHNDGDSDTDRRDLLRMTGIGLGAGALLFSVIGGVIYATDDRSIDVFGSHEGGGVRVRGTF